MRGVVDTCSPRPTTRCSTVATPCYTGVRVVISPCGRPFFISVLLLFFISVLLLFFISVLLLFFISVLLLFFISVLLLFFILVVFFLLLLISLHSFIQKRWVSASEGGP